mmetsp:Transcript_38145/g.80798  ORF Transcript_38145/g.80798 Transcript_38145/m.80798 type:complete len:99 (-) Transcript_38145:148-444(-)
MCKFLLQGPVPVTSVVTIADIIKATPHISCLLQRSASLGEVIYVVKLCWLLQRMKEEESVLEGKQLLQDCRYGRSKRNPERSSMNLGVRQKRVESGFY